MSGPSYVTTTEVPGAGATAEQLAMLRTRYHLAAGLSRQKDVLEVACGAGLGLGLLRRSAATVVGGDRDEEVLRYGSRQQRDGIRLLRLDAHALPFADRSFDVVVLFEALYYLADPERFVAEARRVLRPHGVLVICTANRDWRGFNPSPFSHRYFSAPELQALLASAGFATDTFGGFPVQAAGPAGRALLWARRIAVRLRLIPSTMKGKELLKRVVYGKLEAIPADIGTRTGESAPLVPLRDTESAAGYKVVYAVGRLP